MITCDNFQKKNSLNILTVKILQNNERDIVVPFQCKFQVLKSSIIYCTCQNIIFEMVSYVTVWLSNDG